MSMQDATIQDRRSLRNLYFVRTFVQLGWAALVFGLLNQPNWIAVLLVAYPLWDVACTLYDLKLPDKVHPSRTYQFLNMIAGVATALAIALTVSARPSFAIAAFGVWALVAGALQLVSGLLRRRQIGGQWAMILSGAQSCAAGIAFTIGGLSDKLHAKDLAGYAIFGALYFCLAGVLLARKLTGGPSGTWAVGNS
jgi:hypothetical protein